MWDRIYSRPPSFRLTLSHSSHADGPRSVNYPSPRTHTHSCTGVCACVCVCARARGECSGQCPDMLDSWEICQPSAWAFQTMPHNVLDSPEKQPGAWKLPAHHLNSLIWALSGFPSPSLFPSLSLQLSVCGIAPSLQIPFLSSFTLQALIFFLINTL